MGMNSQLTYILGSKERLEWIEKSTKGIPSFIVRADVVPEAIDCGAKWVRHAETKKPRASLDFVWGSAIHEF